LVTKFDAISAAVAYTVIVADSAVKYFGFGCVVKTGVLNYQLKDFLLSTTTPAGTKELFYVVLRMR
jgi:hypothetical protein